MVDSRTPRRRLFPFVAGGMLIVLAATSLWGLFSVRSEMYAEVERQLQAQLQDRVTTWEEGLLSNLDEWREGASNDPGKGWVYESRLRQKKSWFDSLYLWQAPRVQSVGGAKRLAPGRFLYPLDPPTQRDRLFKESPCLSTPMQASGPIATAQAIVARCQGEPAPIRLYASTEAADHLRRLADLPGADAPLLRGAALEILDKGGLGPSISLRAGINQLGVDPGLLAAARLQRAELLFALSRDTEGIEQTFDVGMEIAGLDAPEFRRVYFYIQRIRGVLKAHDQRALAARFERGLDEATRRLRAYEEIKDNLLSHQPAQASVEARFIYDQYSEMPFLLYYGLVHSGETGAAIQLDQEALLADFLGGNKRWRNQLVFTDLNGRVIAGTQDGGRVVVEVPFSRTLTHLRVGMRQEALDERLDRLAPQWVVPAAIVMMCLAIGIMALWYQILADRQLQALLIRQREFTARVTHELKTPLAGIKIMAENLEAGRYRDQTMARQMALSILQEADRLAQRVNEILDVAKERKIPDPKPFDPEEAALEAIDTWGPRLEQAGVTLNADLDAAESVLGDGNGMRDALGCLLDNALKYRKEDRDDGQVWLTLRQEGETVFYEVKDNGIGVPRDKREEIFERFVRVEGPNRGTAGGHGLGLAQVRQVVEQHGGTVECREGEEGGALFVIRLPAIPART